MANEIPFNSPKKDLVFKVKSTKEAKSLYDIIDELSNDITKDALKDVAAQSTRRKLQELPGQVAQAQASQTFQDIKKEKLLRRLDELGIPSKTKKSLNIGMSPEEFSPIRTGGGQLVNPTDTDWFTQRAIKDINETLATVKTKRQIPKAIKMLQGWIRPGEHVYSPWYQQAVRKLEAIGNTVGKDATGMLGLIPMDLKQQYEQTSADMIMQVLSRLGMQNVKNAPGVL